MSNSTSPQQLPVINASNQRGQQKRNNGGGGPLVGEAVAFLLAVLAILILAVGVANLGQESDAMTICLVGWRMLVASGLLLIASRIERIRRSLKP